MATVYKREDSPYFHYRFQYKGKTYRGTTGLLIESNPTRTTPKVAERRTKRLDKNITVEAPSTEMDPGRLALGSAKPQTEPRMKRTSKGYNMTILGDIIFDLRS